MPRGPKLDGKLDGDDEVLTHQEVLRILSEQARKGSVSAATALERALRRDQERTEDEVGNAIDQILTKN